MKNYNTTEETTNLAYFKGKYWFIDLAYRGNKNWLFLVKIPDTSMGIKIKRTEARLIIGEEYNKQMEAINYFLSGDYGTSDPVNCTNQPILTGEKNDKKKDN